jgi:hypothetical protein
MALHSSLLSDRQRELVPTRMMYPVEPSGLLGTSKIMQYKTPDYGIVFNGDTGNNIVRFTVNGPGLLDPRSLYIRYSMKNVTSSAGKLYKCDPASYSPFKRIRILSGFNQQVLYDNDGYNVMCAFLDDYLKDVHDLTCDPHGFYALNRDYVVSAAGGATTSAASAQTDGNVYVNEFLDWSFKPQMSAAPGATTLLGGEEWESSQKLFTLCDLPYVGLFTQGKYLPLWGMGGLIIEIYLDNAASWCSTGVIDPSSTAVPAVPVPVASVEIGDVQLYYDNVVPPSDFLEGMKSQINSPEGLSIIFPSVNRHLSTLSDNTVAGAAPSLSQTTRQELLIADHSRMAQSVFQIFRPQALIQDPNRPYKLHNRTSACIAQWQLKLNSAYLPQQPLVSVSRDSQNLSGNVSGSMTLDDRYGLLKGRQYGQFLKELYKAFHQYNRVASSVTPTSYEVLTDGPTAAGGSAAQQRQNELRATRGAFAIGIDLTVSDDVMTGTNLRNATVTGEMFALIDRFRHPSATTTEVQTYVMKLSQIRMTSAGPIIVD